MEITGIGIENEEAFGGILPTGYGRYEALRLGVIDGEEPYGAAEVITDEGISHITSFYILPDYRRLGAGTMLFSEIEAMSKKNGQVGIRGSFAENDELFDFFLAMGCVVADGEQLDCLSVEELKSLDAVAEASGKDYKDVRSLGDLDKKQMDDLRGLFSERGFDAVSVFMPLSDPKLSKIYISDGVPKGAILADESDGDIYVYLLAVRENAGQTVLLKLLPAFIKQVMESDKKYSDICFYPGNEKLISMIKRLLGDDATISRKGSMKVIAKAL